MAYQDANFAIAALRKFDRIERERLKQIRVPQFKPGTAMPLFYGKVRHRSPMVLWWGDLDSNAVEEDDSIIAYRYQFGVLMGLGAIGADGTPGNSGVPTLHRIWIGDKILIGKDPSRPSSSTFDSGTGAPANGGRHFIATYSGFFGVPGSGGTWSGSWGFYPGNFSQTADSYLVNNVDELGATKVPAYRGQCYILFKGASASTPTDWGENTILPDMSFEVSWYPTRLISGVSRIGDDANPAEVIYDLLVNPWGRLGLSPDKVDANSFRAVADVLFDEENGVSLVVDSNTPARKIINDIIKQIDGTLYEDTKTGRLTLKLIREDYTVSDLDLLDESNTKLGGYGTTMWSETYNQVRAAYNSRERFYIDDAATAQSMANWKVQGEKYRTREMTFPYCTTETLANKLASRELKPVATPIITARFLVNRDAFDFFVGMPFRFTWGEWSVTDVVFRVQSIDWGTLEDETITIEAVQDIFALDQTVFNPRNLGLGNPIILDPSEPDEVDGWEIPRFIGIKAEVEDTVDDSDGAWVQMFAKPATSDAGTAFDLGITDVTRGDFGDGGYQSRVYSASFEVETAYAKTEGPYDTVTGLRIKNVSDESLLVSASAAEVADGANLILVGGGDSGSIYAFESVTAEGGGVFTLNNVWGDILDTPRIDLAVDDRGWFILAGSKLKSASRSRFAHGAALTLTALPRDGAQAKTFDTATSVAQKALTIVSRAVRPYPPADLKALDSADGKAPSTLGSGTVSEYPGVAVEGETNPQVVGSELTLTYNERDHESPTITRGDAASEANDNSYRAFFDAGDSFGDRKAQQVTLEAVGQLDAGLHVLSHGAGSLGVDALLGSYSNRFGEPSGSLASRSKVSMPAEIAFYRQLLVNPSFDDTATPFLGQGWTVISGPANYSSDASAYGFRGRYAHADANTFTIEQQIQIDALTPEGQEAKLIYKARNFAAAGNCVQVQLITRDTGLSDLDTADSGAISPSTAHWDSNTLSIAAMDPDTFYIAVRIILTYSAAGGGLEGALDELDLRIAPDISAQLLTNPDFNTNLTGWTTSGGEVVQTATNKSDGAGCCYMGNSAALSAYIEQTVVLPDGFKAEGDIVHVRLMVYANDDDFADPLIQIRNSGASVLRSVDIDDFQITADGDWHSYELFLKMPANAYDVRVRMDGVLEASPTVVDLYWDQIELHVYSAVGESAGVGVVAGTSTATAVGEAIIEGVGLAEGVCKVEGFKGE